MCGVLLIWHLHAGTKENHVKH